MNRALYIRKEPCICWDKNAYCIFRKRKKNSCSQGDTNSAPLFIGDFSHTRRPVTYFLHKGLFFEYTAPFSNLQISFRICSALFEYTGQRLFRTCSDAIIARVLCVAIYIVKECSPIYCKRDILKGAYTLSPTEY